MKNIILSFCLLLLFGFQSTKSQAQTTCKVLLENIATSYSGECRKGLAHGKGLAIGTDEYKGAFKKGYPHGNGTMTYKGSWRKGKRSGNGTYTTTVDGKEVVKKGLWKNDKYVGKKKTKQYRVLNSTNVRSYTIRKVNDKENKVTIEIWVNNEIRSIPRDLNGDSGRYSELRDRAIFEDVTHPFTANLSYEISQLGSNYTLPIKFAFKILGPGNWLVSISHNNN